MTLDGLVIPTPTLFGPDGTLDPEANHRFLAGLAASTVPHLFVLGSLGEFASLDDAERDVLLGAAGRAVRPGTDLWVGVGAPATRRAIAYARSATAAGAAVVIAVPPYYLRPTDAAIAAYYRALHASVPVPLLAYNIPKKVGYALSPELVHHLAREGVLQGIKDTSESPESVLSFLRGAPPGFAVMPGDDNLARWAIGQGASGAVMGTANIVPKLGLALVQAARAHDEPKSTELQRLVDALGAVVGAGPFPATVKFLAHRWRGADEGYRAPYDALSSGEAEAVLERFRPLEAELARFR